MSLVYKNKVLTLSNYLRLLSEDFSVDVLDEIRLAIMDNTPLSMSLLDSCKEDSYKLSQYRHYINEYIPSKYLLRGVSGRNLFLIRRCFALGLDLDWICKYQSTGSHISISPATLDSLLESYLDGVDVTRIDMSKFPEDCVKGVLSGLEHHYPMWLLEDCSFALTPQYIRALSLTFMFGNDVLPFLSETWDTDVIKLLSSETVSMSSGLPNNLYKDEMTFAYVLRFLTPKFPYSLVKSIVRVAVGGFPIDDLCLVDSEGYPLLSLYQVESLARFIINGVLYDDIKEKLPAVTDVELDDIYEERYSKLVKKPRLSGKL